MLVLVRHGESEWNKLNLFTGWKDVDLSENGIEEARRAGQILRREGLSFDVGFTSALKRAQRTLHIILAEMGQSEVTVHVDAALNERDYGDLAGLNKDDAREKWGAEQVHIWRRSYDTPPPGGESLKDTADRVIPYYQTNILPEILAGKTVIISAHGNSLRSLIMELDGMSPDEIVQLNLATGVPILYRFNIDGTVATKRDLAA